MTQNPDLIGDELSSSAPTRAPPPVLHRARVALIAISILTLTLVAWSTWDRIRTGLEREQALADQLTGAAAERLNRRLQSIEHRLAGFVDREKTLLDELATTPAASAVRSDLWSLLQLEFPQAKAALILDDRGARVAGLGNGLGGKEGGFLRRSVRGEIPSIRFTERDEELYADFAAIRLRDGKPAGALLLCLSCSGLCLPEAASIPKGHELHLAPSSPGATGALVDVAVDRVSRQPLAQFPIGDSGWVLQDRLDSRYRSQLVFGRFAAGIGLCVAFLLATYLLHRWLGARNGHRSYQDADSRESRLKLQAVLSATTDGIISTDQKGQIELFNPAAEMMFGHLGEDVRMTNVVKLLPDFFSTQDAASFLRQRDASQAPPVVHETQGRHRDGRRFPVRLWLNSVRFNEQPHLLIIAQDLTEQQRNDEHLVFLEQRDVLTGLLNRREFEKRLNAVIADPQHRPTSPHVLCHIDVDQFKLINDTCGHEAGDALLKQLAMLIRSKLDAAEIIGRFGGDEFMVLFRNRNAKEAREVCEGLTQTVRNFLFTWRDQSFDIAVSMGLAEFTPANEGPSSALSKADVACHMAKRHGRDRIHIYSEGDTELIRHHGDMRLVSTINQALNDGRFHLYAQPISPITTTGPGRRHFEILVRMLDETGTAIIPDQFIPAAERYILMPAVDRWIVNRLFSLQAENLRAWHATDPDNPLFAVNLSGTSIVDDGFLRYLTRQFTEWEVPHPSICFEITETAAISDLERARTFMQELSALGCSFALDDFGTGLSSYSYLKELPVDYLKIDGSFVRGLSDDPVSYALVESITQIGHVLGIKTIAEWAEDKSTLMQLRALNVDFAQGFGIGAPVPVCDLTLADTLIPPQSAASARSDKVPAEGSATD